MFNWLQGQADSQLGGAKYGYPKEISFEQLDVALQMDGAHLGIVEYEFQASEPSTPGRLKASHAVVRMNCSSIFQV